MASSSVTPETFTYVLFDADELTSWLDTLREVLDLSDRDVRLDVLEDVPFGRAKVVDLDPITFSVESGALEDPLRPRQLSAGGSADILGQLLLQARDRLDPSFGAPELSEDIPQPVKVAWDIYCVGRLWRALQAAGHPIEGFRPQVQRRRYTFRTRHGFTDVADEQFELLWTADGLSWADIVAASGRAEAATAA